MLFFLSFYLWCANVRVHFLQEKVRLLAESRVERRVLRVARVWVASLMPVLDTCACVNVDLQCNGRFLAAVGFIGQLWGGDGIYILR